MRLFTEAENTPIGGWDFSWLDGRATEDRPPWRYADLLARSAAVARAMLDLQTGDGELISSLPDLPTLTVATEAWPPNVSRAARKLHRRNRAITCANDSHLPFGSETFDLVSSRHPD